MNNFDFTTHNSADFSEMVVQELPPIIRPTKRTNIRYVDGVDGAIVEELGYDLIEKTVIFGLKNTTNIDVISAWLTGSGEVAFSNEPGKYYLAQVVNGINYERLGRFRTASVTFLCQPYKYTDNDTTPSFNTAGAKTLTNLGTVISLPRFVVTSTSTVTIAANGNTISLAMDATNNKLTVDCELQNVFTYNTSTLKNSLMTGEHIYLNPGANTVTLGGTFTSVLCYPRSRFI